MGKHRGSILLIILLLILILGWWLLATMHAGPSQPATQAASVATSTTTTLAITLPLIVHHSTAGGEDTYSGLLEPSGLCASISSGISSSGQNPAHIILLLSAGTTTPCANATSTSDDFSLSFQNTHGMNSVLNGVMFNGTAIPYTLVEDK